MDEAHGSCRYSGREGSATSPSDAGVTLRDSILHQCLNKLFSKPSELQCYQDHRKHFVVSSAAENGIGRSVAGLVEHAKFKELLQKNYVAQILKESGVSTKEIDIVLNCDDSPTNIEGTLKTDHSIRHVSNLPRDTKSTETLASLEGVLQKLVHQREAALNFLSEPERFRDSVVLSRREYDEALRQGRLENSEVFVKVRPNAQPAVHPDHPLNHLADLERELFPKRRKIHSERDEYSRPQNKKADVEFVTEVESKEMLGRQCNYVDENNSCHSYSDIDSNCKNVIPRISLWDQKEFIPVFPRFKNTENSKVSLLPASNRTTLKIAMKDDISNEKKKDYSRGFICMPETDQLISISEIKNGCTPAAELLHLFPRHCTGSPSRTLYVKNLSPSCTPQDLVSVFGNFDEGIVRATYRLLNGKMRGQAFVRLADEEAASRALSVCQGFKIKGKPMVLEYGREQKEQD